jgi:UPF0042 nucleotide-binding protein
MPAQQDSIVAEPDSVDPDTSRTVAARPRRVVLVTGLSGAGKASTLRVLEDLGYEAVDNPPLPLMEEMVVRGERPAAICVDTRSRGFNAGAILETLARLRRNPGLRVELVFIYADETALLSRFTETRRRHPLAPTSRVADGVAAEIGLTAGLREAADLVLDTTDLRLPMLRRIIEQRFSGSAPEAAGMTVSVMSFAYPAGLPRDAELVFDARFLRNPHYDPILRDRTGLDPAVSAYVEADPDYAGFMDKVTDLLTLLLPRFVQEGKKYVSVAIGCTGGQHRSVHCVEVLANRLRCLPTKRAEHVDEAGQPDDTGPEGLWRVVVTHRELQPDGQPGRAARALAALAEPVRTLVRADDDPGAGGLKDSP